MLIRKLFVVAAIVGLSACASAPLTPREYLDEQTAATITAAAQPLIFVAQNSGPVTRDNERPRDYVELYGIDVNRMGTHRQYIALLQWMAPEETSSAAPILELALGNETLRREATSQDPKELGIAQPLAQAYSTVSRWWYYPTDPATLKRIAAAHELLVTLDAPSRRASYEMFSDGRAQLAELTAVLP
jgi:hypothetical protein